MDTSNPLPQTKPVINAERWWPETFSDPIVAGSHRGARYAFFPKERRLLVSRNGRLETYDSRGRQITAFCNRLTHDESLVFETIGGPMNLDELKLVEL